MSYTSWEDLLDEMEGEPEAPPSIEEMLGEIPEIAALMAKRQELEDKMGALIGSGPKTERSPRDEARFPVTIHTAESRLMERRSQEQDANRRLLELKKLAVDRVSRLEEEGKARARAALLADRAAGRRAEELAGERKAMVDRAKQRARLLDRRWEDQRTAALQRRSRDRRDERDWLLGRVGGGSPSLDDLFARRDRSRGERVAQVAWDVARDLLRDAGEGSFADRWEALRGRALDKVRGSTWGDRDQQLGIDFDEQRRRLEALLRQRKEQEAMEASRKRSRKDDAPQAASDDTRRRRRRDDQDRDAARDRRRLD